MSGVVQSGDCKYSETSGLIVDVDGLGGVA
jgi:hypothetical protein